MFRSSELSTLSSFDLSEEQEVQLVRIRRALREQTKQSMQANAQHRQAMMNELAKAQPDLQTMHRAFDAMLEQKRNDGHAAIAQIMQLHASLNDEQRSLLNERLQKMQERMAKMRERRQGRR